MNEPDEEKSNALALRYFMRDSFERQAVNEELIRMIYELVQKLPPEIDRVSVLASIPDRVAAAREKAAADLVRQHECFRPIFPDAP